MLRNKTLPVILACAGIIMAGSLTIAAGAPQGRGQDRGESEGHKQHHHMNGHNALGEKIHQNGKHALGKLGNRTVTAEVKNNKVVNMAADDLMAKRVKSKQKMASASVGTGLQQVQYVQTDYYGYCFDDGLDVTCYWYPADDVDTSGYWDDYIPPY